MIAHHRAWPGAEKRTRRCAPAVPTLRDDRGPATACGGSGGSSSAIDNRLGNVRRLPARFAPPWRRGRRTCRMRGWRATIGIGAPAIGSTCGAGAGAGRASGSRIVVEARGADRGAETSSTLRAPIQNAAPPTVKIAAAASADRRAPRVARGRFGCGSSASHGSRSSAAAASTPHQRISSVAATPIRSRPLRMICAIPIASSSRARESCGLFSIRKRRPDHRCRGSTRRGTRPRDRRGRRRCGAARAQAPRPRGRAGTAPRA